MADDLKIKVQAELDTSKIKSNIPNIESDLAKSEGGKVKLLGKLDLANTKKIIESQLRALGLNAPKIDLQIGRTKDAIAGTNKFKDIIDTSTKSVKNQNIELQKQSNILKEVVKISGDYSQKATTFDTGVGKTKTIVSSKDSILSTTDVTNYKKIEQAIIKANVAATKLGISLSDIKSRIADVNGSRPIKSDEHIKSLSEQYDKVEAAIELVRNADNNTLPQMKANADKEIASLKSMEREFRNIETAATQLRTLDIGTIKDINTNKINQFATDIRNSGVAADIFEQDLIELRTALNSIGENDKAGLTKFLNQFDIAKSKLGAFRSELKSTQNELSFKSDKSIFSNKIISYMNANTKAAKIYREEFEKIQAQLRTVDAAGLKNLKKEFSDLTYRIKAAGQNTKTLGDRLKDAVTKFGTWMSVTTLVSSGVRAIRNMVTSVIELDTAMVDLRKTTDATKSQLQDFYYSSNDTAKSLGVTTAQVINSASAWSRLGYAIEDAQTLAKNSAIFASISPEMDIDQATDGLVSMMKAFKIDADESLDGIISKVNEVGNSFAVSNEMIVEAMQRSSAAMVEGNNTLDQTIAMNTAAIEITQNAEITSTALRTLSMRIRGFDEETEELSTDLINISGDIADLTKTAENAQGISIFTDKSKTEYKSTFEIIKEISDIYDDLTDKQQADLLEKLAGKRSAQTVAALISNFSQAEEAMTTMANSAGGAMEEMAIIEDSLEYKLNRLQETTVGIAQSNVTREFLGGLIDTGTGVLSVLDNITSTLGTLPTLIATIGIGKSFLGTGGDKFDVPRFFKRICPSYACGNTERVYAKMVA